MTRPAPMCNTQSMKIGILGAGGMGNTHARHYSRMPGIELALFEPDADRAAKFSQAWNASLATSAEALIDSVDAVDVCLPTDLHLPLGRQALQAGKPLMMEKPLARTFAEGAELVELADKAGVTFMVAQTVRFFPEFKRAQALVKSGAIGTPAAARTRRGGLAPKSPWFSDYERSGGVLLDLAIHDFDWLRWTLGEVATVFARSVGLQSGRWPDYALTTLQFDSGAVAHVESTWCDPAGGRVTFEVCGSGGMLEHDSRKAQTIRTAIGNEAGTAVPQALEAPLDPIDDPYFNQLKGFVDAVKNGTPPPVTGYDGLMALSIALAAVESAKTGNVVKPTRG